jgi:hypothetical protein
MPTLAPPALADADLPGYRVGVRWRRVTTWLAAALASTLLASVTNAGSVVGAALPTMAAASPPRFVVFEDFTRFT